jgi:N-acetylmuramoyl-L-alanine amidase
VEHRTSSENVRATVVFAVSLRLRPVLVAVYALLLLWLAGAAWAQERHNFLAINGAVQDAAGPYYFVAYGDSGNAYVRAAAFAAAAGLEIHFDAPSKRLTFTAGIRRVVIDATADVREGLVKRPAIVRYDGGELDSPMAILIDGVAYVPITPIVAALGGDSDWHADARVITVDLPDPAAGVQLAAPRIGLNDGVTRVAIDLPSGHPFQVAVNGAALALVLPGVHVTAFSRALEDDPNVAAVAYEMLDGVVALVARTRHPLAPSGVGYRVGQWGDTVYVDFAPDLRGAAATPMADGEIGGPPPPQQPLPAPVAVAEAVPRRYTVVIDAGHGGHDPGAVAAWAFEKDVVLSVALRVKAQLEAEGVQVILTRDGDTFLSLQERSTFATTDRNIFVSIHANGADSGAAHGIETFVFGRPLDPGQVERAIRENGGGDVGAARTAEAERIAADIAGDILRETQLNYSMTLAELVQDRLVGSTGANDRGVRQNLFYVIRNSRIPAILVELGFITHPEEGRRLTEAAYQASLADALADGILTFLRNGGTLAAR